MTYHFCGWATVFDRDGNPVHDAAVLSALADTVAEEDLYQTDYIGGTPETDAIAAVLERSGRIRFAWDPLASYLKIKTTFHAKRPLTDDELAWLKRDTLGQWSDGMGESISVPDGPYKDYEIRPWSEIEVNDEDYPSIETMG